MPSRVLPWPGRSRPGTQAPDGAQAVADIPHSRFDRNFSRRQSICSLLPAIVLAASVLVACGGIPGCSSETESDADKMSGPMARRDTGKLEPETKSQQVTNSPTAG